jgi:general stress protein YciG
MANFNEQNQQTNGPTPGTEKVSQNENKQHEDKRDTQMKQPTAASSPRPEEEGQKPAESTAPPETRPIERGKAPGRAGARGTAAMDPQTRQEVARKGGLAVSRNKQHMAEIGRKGGQSVSKNREHMAQIGRKGGAASRGHR